MSAGDSFDIESEISSVTSHGSFMSVVRAAKLAADQVPSCRLPPLHSTRHLHACMLAKPHTPIIGIVL